MRFPLRGVATAAACTVLLACSDAASPAGPRMLFGPLGTLTDVRIAEIHYDNTGTDAGEAIEVSAPETQDLTGWSLVLYNGSGGASYNTAALGALTPSICSPRKVVVVNYPVNGIQNGSPDGMALVDNNGVVIEFLSYEGTFAATTGPATGLTSTDIGVSEAGTEPLGQSLQRDGAGTWSGPIAATFGTCQDNNVPPPPLPPPPPPALPPVRFTELHYDNIGTDEGEAIEVEGPAGQSLAGWSVVLYNGTGGASYNTTALSGTITGTCNGRGVVVVNYPVNGIQNGSPDGMALVDNNGVVIEFLSYEGTFTAADGPAAGLLSKDIGVVEGTGLPGLTLQRDATTGAWAAPAPGSFGTCNGFTPTPSTATIVINELMADPLRAAGGASWGEWFEVYNYGAAPVDLQGFTLVSAGQPSHVVGSSVIVAPGAFAVLGRGNDPALNGGITIDYNYFTGTATTIFLDTTDNLSIRDAGGLLVDEVRWTNSATIVKGVTRALKSPTLDNFDVDGANWGYSTTPFGDGDFGTPGAPNGTLTDVPPPQPNFLTFTGRLPGDQPLPVGFEDQLFATLNLGSGGTSPSTFTWVAETPLIASIDANGVFRALAPGSASFRATAADGTTGVYTLPTEIATLSTTAQYGNNTEFGEPTDNDPSDDFIVRRDQYTSSYNAARGHPNWVSYDLEATHFGAGDRCDCFTHDPALPNSFTVLKTSDYTGAGTAAGFGIDRGHLARSFDRTSGTLDNAFTYYFTNIMPQASDNNQGPWAILENFLGDQARNANKEVYIIAGGSGSQGTVKNEGKITIPSHTWKVAVIMDRNEGLANIVDYRDVEVIAVIMPNVAGIRNVDWHTYITTVDAVEALSGYDLLALLPDKIEAIVEAGIKPPLAFVNGPFSSNEGSSVSLSGAASVDPNGTVVSWAWDFGDGATGTGATTTHSYAQDGNYTVTLTVTDNDGLTDVVTTTATVANVAPVVNALPGATLAFGGQYLVFGGFADPGADPWSATVNFGDGGGAQPLPLSNQTFTLSHTYCTAGSFAVQVRVNDDDTFGSAAATVTVLSAEQTLRAGITAVRDMIDAGRIPAGIGNAIIVRMDAAADQLDRDHEAAATQLQQLLAYVRSHAQAGRISPDDAAAITGTLDRMVSCLAS